jgi:hypothetical protein
MSQKLNCQPLSQWVNRCRAYDCNSIAQIVSITFSKLSIFECISLSFTVVKWCRIFTNFHCRRMISSPLWISVYTGKLVSIGKHWKAFFPKIFLQEILFIFYFFLEQTCPKCLPMLTNHTKCLPNTTACLPNTIQRFPNTTQYLQAPLSHSLSIYICYINKK